MAWKTFTLSDGTKIPGIAVGSANGLRDDEPAAAYMKQAIEAGFDHLDTAQIYNNESGVGLAIKQSKVPRSKLFITTKWGVDDKSPRQSCEESLKKLGIEYIDLYLIHNSRIVHDDFEGTWKVMEELKSEGKVKSIGVSNYNIEQLTKILKSGNVPPSVNQIQLHPYVYAKSKPLLDFMESKNILAEGYSPLIPITKQPGGPLDQPLSEIANKYRVEPEQILLAWQKAKGVLPVTTSSQKTRLEHYLHAGDIDLTKAEVQAIDDAGAKEGGQ